MTVSGLLTFLPILSAIVGAWANGWHKGQGTKKARDERRER
jgi:hypothetical protein